MRAAGDVLTETEDTFKMIKFILQSLCRIIYKTINHINPLRQLRALKSSHLYFSSHFIDGESIDRELQRQEDKSEARRHGYGRLTDERLFTLMRRDMRKPPW